MTGTRLAGALLACALLVPGCGSTGVEAGYPTLPPTTAPSVTGSTADGSPDPTAVSVSASAVQPSPSLPGEAFDRPPEQGDELAVVGVEFDDVLNVRAGPGTDFDVVDTLEPTARGVVATGRNRLLAEPRAIWDEVTTDEVTGWVNARFVLFPGSEDDVTEDLFARGGLPTASTIVGLGDVVAEAVAAPTSRVVVVDVPGTPDPQVVLDVIGLEDDSVGGLRLHVFAERAEGGGVVLVRVEQTELCARGLSEERLCV